MKYRYPLEKLPAPDRSDTPDKLLRDVDRFLERVEPVLMGLAGALSESIGGAA